MKGKAIWLALCISMLCSCRGTDELQSSPVSGIDRSAGRINNLKVLSSVPAFGGATPTGAVGPYRLITATAYGELDPNASANAGIVNLKSAPVNENGYVDYSTDVVILTPQNPASGKRVVFYDVVNRGNKLGKDTFIGGGALDVGTSPDGTIPSLLQAGYTIVWSGWQGTIAQTGNDTIGAAGAIGANFPVAQLANNSTLVGQSREEFVPDYAGGINSISLTYPPADPSDTTSAVLNARQSWLENYGQGDGGYEIYSAPSTQVTNWHYVINQDGTYSVEFSTPSSVPGPGGKSVPADLGTIYNFVYTAKNPIINGIGFAAVRDLISFLRYQEADAAGDANPLNGLKNAACVGATCAKSSSNFDIAIGEGISQSGRFIRDFLYQGFNEDVNGKMVFDGLMPIIAGGRRTWTNYQFSQPGRWSKQHEDHFMPGFQFPFSYNVITDPISGATDGLLKKCLATQTCPQIMQVDGSYEWWGAGASLVTTDGAGHDLTLPTNVRYYLIAGTQHDGGPGITTGLATVPPSGSICQFTESPVQEDAVERALVPALVNWIAQGAEPPASQYPSVNSGDAVVPSILNFPSLSSITVPSGSNAASTTISVNYTGLYNEIFVTDYSSEIPRVDLSKKYTILVPKVDRNGNETSGIKVPDVAVPIATYTGWNYRGSGHAIGEGCGWSGSAIPFAINDSTKAIGDRRASLASLYGGRSDYQAKIAATSESLVAAGYLLKTDSDNIFIENSKKISPLLIPSP
ncbi:MULTISPECIES: alpha/beta hydrolase domain-containing protein [unclassified Burkholderia]|uniref:alpha/beta hydrolase domain-containing protein n=1 Tax=unclassified Burkholderia TaxID=2613784 RepID=UPI002AAF0E69|nr:MULTISPECIES: alpha/beta hydrolase domain-containing protein [unclassified Burkholderia]